MHDFSINASCHDITVDPIRRCFGKYPVKIDQAKAFNLSAARLATSGESCANCAVSIGTGSIKANTTLQKDAPEINAAIVGDDEAEAPARIKFPNESPVKNYRLQVKDIKTGAVILSDDFVSNETALFNALEPRRDYLETLQILNGPGGHVVGEMFRTFTTGDLGLVGWWRFKDDPNKFDCSGESLSRTVCDFSGRGNHGDPNNSLAWINNDSAIDGALDFQGVNRIAITHSDSLEFGDSLTISCSLKVGNNYSPVGIMVKDNPDPGPFFIEQVDPHKIEAGVYTFEGSVGSWKGLGADISALGDNSFRITATFNGTTLSLYINDQLFGSKLVAGLINNFPQTLWLGYSPFHNGFFNGVLHNCMVLDRALSEDEINRLPGTD